jgi:hypothetical protein
MVRVLHARSISTASGGANSSAFILTDSAALHASAAGSLRGARGERKRVQRAQPQPAQPHQRPRCASATAANAGSMATGSLKRRRT